MKLFAQTSKASYTVQNINVENKTAEVVIDSQAHGIEIVFYKGVYLFMASKAICSALGVAYNNKVAVKIGFDMHKLSALIHKYGNAKQPVNQQDVEDALAAKKAAQKEAAKKRTPMGYSEQVLAGTYRE